MAEEPVFWKWFSSSEIGVVTETAVYHWSIEASSGDPSKVFDRHASLTGNQIINYKVKSDGQWMVLTGISAQNGKVVGAMQLYNKQRNVSQALEGHAASFAELVLENSSVSTSVFAFAVRQASGVGKLHLVEIDHQDNAPVFPKKAVDMLFPPDAVNDFPVSMQVSSRYSVIFVVTKYGFVHLYDLETGTCIFMNRISGDTIFVTCDLESTSGMIGVNRKGQVLSVSVDTDRLVPYLLSNLRNEALAYRMATRNDLPGAEQVVLSRFESLMSAGQFGEAAKVAALSPRGILRTPQTLDRFKGLSAAPGTVTPILQYFGLLLEKGTLNPVESLELAKPVLQQGRKQLLEKWLKEDKLACTEELGDTVRPHDVTLALSIYLRANIPRKVCECMAALGEFEKMVLYSQKVGFEPDFRQILRNLVQTEPERSVQLASMLVKDPKGPKISLEFVVELFQAAQMVQQATSFLLDVLKDDKQEHAKFQTLLLTMNLRSAPQVADAILGSDMFHHYDKEAIAQACEQAGLYQRALEHYSQVEDLKRTLTKGGASWNADWLVAHFGHLSVEQSLGCLEHMLKMNPPLTMPSVKIATQFGAQLDINRLIGLFEKSGRYDGLFYFLGTVIAGNQSPEVHFKYIQAGIKTGQYKEVERICRESSYYDPEAVKNYLKEVALQDPTPLLVVCDRFDFVHELVLHLFHQQQFKAIELFVHQVAPQKAPAVLGALLDVGCDENVCKQLLASVPPSFEVNDLVDQCERRNRLKLVLPWLEKQVKDGSQDVGVFNALAKIYVDTNQNAELFLKQNPVYDSAVVGAYCEKRDPYLAVLAYERGQCDHELVRVTTDNAMFKQQARYLVKRRNLELWAHVLRSDNPCRRSVIDQVVGVALPDSQDPEDVSVTVKAFMAADLPQELVELLEKLVLETTTAFSDNRNLQNLLILTAMKADPARIMDYVTKLENFDAPDIAQIAIKNGLFEEAFSIYQRYDQQVEAMQVLVGNIGSLSRAQSFAEKVDNAAVWSLLGQAQLEQGQLKESVDSFIKSQDPTHYPAVISLGKRLQDYTSLALYLEMARIKAREPAIESELLFSYASLENLTKLKSLASQPNLANMNQVAQRCYDAGLYEAAKILFHSVSNWASLALTLLKLGDFQMAVECARKGSSTLTWRQVNESCVASGEFQLAHIAGLQLIVHAEELEGVVRAYEQHGNFKELAQLLEAGIHLERAHMGLFTELAIHYTKHSSSKLLDHVKLYKSRLHAPRVIRACEAAHCWKELVYVYQACDEFDNAALTIMEHGAIAFDHALFKDVISRVANLDVCYRSLQFYLDEHPMLINDLLSVLSSRIDHSRVVQLFSKKNHLPLIKPYLVSVLGVDNTAVNHAYHDLLVEERDYKSLRDAVDHAQHFDYLELAQRLEKHELLEFRRIAAHLYKRNRKWKHALQLASKDSLFRDRMDIVAESRSTELINETLESFLKDGNNEAFAAALYVCNDLLQPDKVLELAWRYGVMDFALPYMIQSLYQLNNKVQNLEQQLINTSSNPNNLEGGSMPQPLMITYGGNPATPNYSGF